MNIRIVLGAQCRRFPEVGRAGLEVDLAVAWERPAVRTLERVDTRMAPGCPPSLVRRLVTALGRAAALRMFRNLGIRLCFFRLDVPHLRWQ